MTTTNANTEKEKKVYLTTDRNTAILLFTFDIPLLSAEKNEQNKTVFMFPQDEKCKEIVNRYRQHSLPPVEFPKVMEALSFFNSMIHQGS